MSTPPFDLATVAAATGPLLVLMFNAEGRPCGAQAGAVIKAPRDRAWKVVSDLERLPGRIPMISKVKPEGADRVSMQLRFKVSIFSASFGFLASVKRESERALELSYISGEPRDLKLRFELHDHPTDPAHTVAYVTSSFDLLSLGWLANYFLKGHPEIQFGVFPGSALSLIDAVQRAAALDVLK